MFGILIIKASLLIGICNFQSDSTFKYDSVYNFLIKSEEIKNELKSWLKIKNNEIGKYNIYLKQANIKSSLKREDSLLLKLGCKVDELNQLFNEASDNDSLITLENFGKVDSDYYIYFSTIHCNSLYVSFAKLTDIKNISYNCSRKWKNRILKVLIIFDENNNISDYKIIKSTYIAECNTSWK